MSGKLDGYFAGMDRLLSLDSRYRRPGYTMDMNDCAYLYTLAVYSILMLQKLGIRVDARLGLPNLMEEKAQSRYVYGLEYYGNEEDEEEDYAACDYYARRWTKMYEPYTGRLSRKNAYCELSEFMHRFLLDVRKNSGLGLWTLFSERDCMELCSMELHPAGQHPGEACQDTDTAGGYAISQAVTYFMCSRDNAEMLRQMGISLSRETKNEISHDINNTLFIYGIFAMTSAKAEKITAALKGGNIRDSRAKSFAEKCAGLDSLLWRPGATILADYTNNYEAVTRTQIIGDDSDFGVSFDYAEISPLLPAYLHYLEKAAEEMDRVYFGGQILKEGTDGKQKRED